MHTFASVGSCSNNPIQIKQGKLVGWGGEEREGLGALVGLGGYWQVCGGGFPSREEEDRGAKNSPVMVRGRGVGRV